MKKINQFITEYIIKKKLDKPIDSEDHSEYFPKTKEELIENIKECFDNKRYNLNCINTSKITDMSYIFKLIPESHDINFDVSGWDVSNVEYMQHMFYECIKFNCDLSDWNVSNVKNMGDMFCNCLDFEGNGLENWDVSNVKDMHYMFFECTNFNCDLSKWNVNNVTNMNYIFDGCKSLKNTPSWYKE